MTVQKQIDRLLTHRASEWIDILKTGGPQEQAAFVDWLRESRRHVEEYLTMVALERELGTLDFKDLVDRQALLARISSRVTPLREETPAPTSAPAPTTTPKTRLRWKTAVALAAGLSTITVAAFWASNTSFTREFAATNEQRAIELADGSVVQLNSHSTVRVNLGARERTLELVNGEALFKVARDPRRPFRVHSHDAVVEALGTQFNVHEGEQGTTVSVLEGKVQVSLGPTQPHVVPAAFIAGEEVQIGAGKIERNADADVTAAIAWRQRRLVFQTTALEEVVRQFNRHNATPKLRLENIEPGSRHYSASFDADDPLSFGDFLGREPDLTIERRGEEIIIRGKSGT